MVRQYGTAVPEIETSQSAECLGSQGVQRFCFVSFLELFLTIQTLGHLRISSNIDGLLALDFVQKCPLRLLTRPH